jgi:hypothetical protein
MLYIVLDIDGHEMEKTWHVGEPCDITPEVAAKVMLVQADSDELTHIVRHFQNLPFAKARLVQTWRGDLAKFIAENLVA